MFSFWLKCIFQSIINHIFGQTKKTKTKLTLTLNLWSPIIYSNLYLKIILSANTLLLDWFDVHLKAFIKCTQNDRLVYHPLDNTLWSILSGHYLSSLNRLKLNKRLLFFNFTYLYFHYCPLVSSNFFSDYLKNHLSVPCFWSYSLLFNCCHLTIYVKCIITHTIRSISFVVISLLLNGSYWWLICTSFERQSYT